ncbi:hypothetical protein KC19_7G098400 [Ceratodon purpureus]|nr:hypothetical protein KC19_7G098400 [Ceratodon purpureus]
MQGTTLLAARRAPIQDTLEDILLGPRQPSVPSRLNVKQTVCNQLVSRPELPAMSDENIKGMTSEQLLLICASAVEQNDVGTVEQAVSALQRMSSINGEPSERVTAYFLQALLRRGGSMLDPSFSSGAHELPTSHEVQWTERRWSLNELTRFVDFTPYFRFGYTAANGAMLEAFEGMEHIHILDFSTTHGMQWPTFIEALADRAEGPPNFRLTLSSAALPTAPRLQTSYEEVGLRLANYARLKNVPFQFQILPQPLSLLTGAHFNLRDGEALGVNLSLRLHYLADETIATPQGDFGAAAQPLCPRDQLLHLVRSLNPAVVTLYEEDCDTTSTDVVRRVEQSYAYEWMPFDFLATFWPPGHAERQEYEMNVGRKIENIIACEGANRLERLESKRQWLQRMARLRFRAQPVNEEVVSQLQDVVDHHNTGWGMKHDEEDCTQSLLWKGNSLTFASAWIPAP